MRNMKELIKLYCIISERAITKERCEIMNDEEDLKRVIDLYSDTIRRICFIYLKQKSDVEDIFQNIFIKYMKSKKEFNDLEHEKAWFIRVTINECKNFLKSWFHKNVDLIDDFQSFSIENDTKEYDVLKAVLNLNEKYRNVVYLYYYEGYSLKDIADILGKKENTIYTWHLRAKNILKSELGDDYFE